jgi:hypothetical protein
VGLAYRGVRPIRLTTVTGGKVGQGGVLGVHGMVGKRLEVHERGGLTRGAVSTGVRLGRRGMAVRGSVQWWWSAAHGLGQWPGHGRSLGWRRWSGRAASEA